MLVYRDSSEKFSGAQVLKALEAAFETLTKGHTRDEVVDALMRAGEVECALADLDLAKDATARTAAEVTDAAAALLVDADNAGAQVERARALIPQLRLPEAVTLRPAEGFAYYALHPLQYAAMAQSFESAKMLAIVGIRSIGTTLTAVVRAAACARGVDADRITVRPQGDPYNRELVFSTRELRWVQDRAAGGAVFLVVDEGPGRSGSSFLATAEALERAGVSADCIVLLCSYEPDVKSLLARDAEQRWHRFKSIHPGGASGWLSSLPQPANAAVEIGAGKWRRRAFTDEAEWPASWIQNERLKFIDGDRRRLFKFEGHGRFGEAVRKRAELVARVGFGPTVRSAAEGFVAYEFIRGAPARSDLTPDMLDRLARYCAFRASEFVTEVPEPDAINEMLVSNLQDEFRYEPTTARLQVVRPVIADGHMHPHEWVRAAGGDWMKTDAASHGDDHFYPGATDIAWDLAGCIVEWHMERGAMQYFLERYKAGSGDDPEPRIQPWLLAYTAFRLGYSRMATESLRGTAEETRLQADCRRYRAVAENLIRAHELSYRAQSWA